ncbi:MAG: CHAT domain-containing protein [Ardenticatenaceae bacterium]|nr:CHAT domain-containing protein [Ardenticatenaceae bacterium]
MANEFSPAWIQELISQEPEAQLAALAAADLLNDDGLQALFETAQESARQTPAEAFALAELVSEAARQSGSSAAVGPTSAYFQAQLLTQQGQFDRAAAQIEIARQGFEQLGMQIEAWRTQIGLMNIWGESGRPDDALAVGDRLAVDLATHTNASDADSVNLMTALLEQNRGRCFEYLGRYDDALLSYDAAEDRYRTLGLEVEIGHIELNRGLIYLDIGRAFEARVLFESALARFQAADLPLLQAQALTNLGDAAGALGSFDEALTVLNEARAIFQALQIEAEEQLLNFDRGNIYLTLNLYPEAEGAFQEAAAFFRERQMIHYLARTQWGLAIAHIAQHQNEAAESALEEAAALFSASGHKPLQAAVALERAALLANAGERGQALQNAQQALDLLNGVIAPVQRAFVHLRLADLILPDVTAAARHLQQAAEAADELSLPQLTFRIQQRLGHLRLLEQRFDDALPLLQDAVTQIEQLRSTLPRESLRLSFLQDKTAAYEDLIQLYLSLGTQEGIDQAFAVTEQAKSRSLVDLLQGLVTVNPSSDSERLQSLQARLNALYNTMFADDSGPDETLRGVRIDMIRQQADEIEREIRRLELDAQLTAPTAPTPLAAPLSPEQQSTPLIVYHIVRDEVLAFVQIDGRREVFRQLMAVDPLMRLLERLTQQWSRFNAGDGFVERHLWQLERSTQRLLLKLYKGLIEPLIAYLPDGGQLAIIPFGALHHLPFHALFDGEKYLLDRFEIAYAPSVSILELCQQRPLRHHRPPLIMGVTAGAIPHVADEVLALNELLADSQLYLDEEATSDVLIQEAAAAGMIHLACHGLFRTDNPMFSSLRLHDRWVSASELMRLDLTGALITLSACESGRHRVYAGDELVGLSRAALGAGASAVVVSKWLAHDAATADLMTHFYRFLQQGTACATALREAQLITKNRYSHPFYWAPFVLMGHF